MLEDLHLPCMSREFAQVRAYIPTCASTAAGYAATVQQLSGTKHSYGYMQRWQLGALV